MDLRRIILDRIKEKGVSRVWMLDVYQHLLSQQIPADEAMKALERFVDELIDRKLAAKLEKV